MLLSLQVSFASTRIPHVKPSRPCTGWRPSSSAFSGRVAVASATRMRMRRWRGWVMSVGFRTPETWSSSRAVVASSVGDDRGEKPTQFRCFSFRKLVLVCVDASFCESIFMFQRFFEMKWQRRSADFGACKMLMRRRAGVRDLKLRSSNMVTFSRNFSK